MSIGTNLFAGLFLSGATAAQAYTLDCGNPNEPAVQLLCQQVAARLDREGPRAEGVAASLDAQLVGPLLLQAELTLTRGNQSERIGPMSLSVTDRASIPAGQISMLVDALFAASTLFPN